MTPTFVLSLDEELIWGSFDHTREKDFAARYPDLRGVVSELLALQKRYEIRATWALVGHLFLHECDKAHKDIVRPRYAWHPRDWFAEDPGTNREKNPLWYGDDIVAAITASDNELASHSFSHMVFGDSGCSAEAARSELQACLRVSPKKLRSFIFPRNKEGHPALLKEFGFTAYRGTEPSWYARLPLKRAAHFVDQALALTPPVVQPQETLPGLWNIPASMFFMHREGARRFISMRARVQKAKRGIDAAIARAGIFHLWFHPFNMCADREKMFAALEEIFAYVRQTKIAVRTMGELAEELRLSQPRD